MNSPQISTPFLSIFIGVLVLLLFAGSNYRAAKMSMTHDESSTYLNYAEVDILACFSNRNCFHTANNHLLNTALLQQTVKWFGLSEWSIRLPNVLAHLLYLLSSWALVYLISPKRWLRLTGFALLNFNLYLLDFFTVARGYGLAMGLTMAATTCLFYYLRHPRMIWILALFICSFFGVFAVFTSLVFWFAVWGTLVMAQLYQLWQKQTSWRFVLLSQLIPLGLTVVLGVVLYQPIQWLQAGGEFRWGAPNLYHTFYYLVEDSLHGPPYIGNDAVNKMIFQLLVGIFLTTGLILTVRQLFQKQKTNSSLYLLTASGLLLLPVVIIVLQYFILDSLFLVNRKSLLFIPPAGLITYLVLTQAYEYRKRLGQVLSIAVLLFCSFHLVARYKTDHCREWWYDRYTKETALFLDQQAKEKETLTIGTHWMFHPSLEFYRKHVVKNQWKRPTYSKELLRDSTFDYFYVFRGDYQHLEPYYIPVDTFSWTSFILENRIRVKEK